MSDSSDAPVAALAGLDRARVLQLLQDAATEIKGPEAPLLDEDLELSESDIDSLEVIEMIMIVEDALDVVIEPEDFVGATTVAHLIDVVLSKVGQDR